MSDPQDRSQADEVSDEPGLSEADSLNALRSLLLGEDDDRLRKLLARFTDPNVMAADISEVLPDAVIVRSHQDDRLSKALMPTIEGAIKNSVHRNPHSIVDALFPIIGPAIRKSIAETVRGMIQSFNQALEHSFSWNGIKWRIEALRTGVPFGEIVLLNSLVYRVEQIFLIHKETGLLLHHAVADETVAQDGDMVSGMLTAIQDFVRDSFGVSANESLNTLNIGDLTVWVEEGTEAVLAAVVRGTPPEELRGAFRDALRQLHLEQREAFEAFSGDIAPFEETRPVLQDCMQARYQAPKRKLSPVFYLVVLALLFGLGVLAYYGITVNRKWSAFLARVRAEPGITLISVESTLGKRIITGLRDPMAADPVNYLAEWGLSPDRLETHWEPYQALHPAFILERARGLLAPPEGVSLTFDGEVLRATGEVSQVWIEEASRLALFVTGVKRFDGSGLRPSELHEIERLRAAVQDAVVKFVVGTTTLIPGQEEAIQQLAFNLRKLSALLDLLDRTAVVKIVGHTDQSGSERTNQELSAKRAEFILDRYGLRALPTLVYETLGVGATQPVREDAPEFNRSVSFEVILAAAM